MPALPLALVNITGLAVFSFAKCQERTGRSRAPISRCCGCQRATISRVPSGTVSTMLLPSRPPHLVPRQRLCQRQQRGDVAILGGSRRVVRHTPCASAASTSSRVDCRLRNTTPTPPTDRTPAPRARAPTPDPRHTGSPPPHRPPRKSSAVIRQKSPIGVPISLTPVSRKRAWKPKNLDFDRWRHRALTLCRCAKARIRCRSSTLQSGCIA